MVFVVMMNKQLMNSLNELLNDERIKKSKDYIIQSQRNETNIFKRAVYQRAVFNSISKLLTSKQMELETWEDS